MKTWIEKLYDNITGLVSALLQEKLYVRQKLTENESELDSHIGDNVRHITTAERSTWNAKETPTGAQNKVDAHANLTNNPHEVTKSQVGLSNVDNVKQATKEEFDTHVTNSAIHVTASDKANWNNKIDSSEKGIADGIAELDSNGFVLSSQLPSFVDDVLDGVYINSTRFDDLNGIPYPPESGKIYVDVVTRMTYRWSGTTYVTIGNDLTLGETSSTAYRGDRGKIAYDHSLIEGNPHNTTIEDIPGLGSALENIDTLLGHKQDTLISGDTIKTINGETLLGEGNIEILPVQLGSGLHKDVNGVTNLGLDISTGEGFLTENLFLIRNVEDGSYRISLTNDATSFGKFITGNNFAGVSVYDGSTEDGIGLRIIRETSDGKQGFEMYADDRRMILFDQINNIGLTYDNNYYPAGSLNNRWIPDWGAVKNYVDNAVGPGSVNVGSGLHIDSEDKLTLGLNPETLGTTNEGLLTKDLLLWKVEDMENSRFSSIELGDAAVILRKNLSLADSISVSLSENLVDNNPTFQISKQVNGYGQSFTMHGNENNAMVFSDDIGNKGLTYDNNYFEIGSLDDRWIPDWGAVKYYVDNAVSPGLQEVTDVNSSTNKGIILTKTSAPIILGTDPFGYFLHRDLPKVSMSGIRFETPSLDQEAGYIGGAEVERGLGGLVLSYGNSSISIVDTEVIFSERVTGRSALTDSQFVTLGQLTDILENHSGGDSLFNTIDVTQTDYQNKAINVIPFNNSGMTYSEGAIDLGITRDSIHTMGRYAFKQGIETIASGRYSSAFGYGTTASGRYSSAFGYGTTASSNYSSAFGYETTVSGAYSSAFGYRTTASGPVSIAFGDQTVANEYACLAIGKYSTEGTAQTSWVSGSPIFKVGNGTEANRSNAYVLYNNGNSEQFGNIVVRGQNPDHGSTRLEQSKLVFTQGFNAPTNTESWLGLNMGGIGRLIFPNSGTTEKIIPVSVNNIPADLNGNIEIDFTPSDIRLKNTLTYPGLSNISSLKPTGFVYKDSAKNKRIHFGYIAQEVKEVMPGAVKEDKDGMLSVNYVEVLVAKMEAMEAKMKELEARVNKLEN